MMAMEQAVQEFAAVRQEAAKLREDMKQEISKQSSEIENMSPQYSQSVQRMEAETTKFAEFVAQETQKYAGKTEQSEKTMAAGMEAIMARSNEQSAQSVQLDAMMKEGFRRIDDAHRESTEAKAQQAAATTAAFARFEAHCALKMTELTQAIEMHESMSTNAFVYQHNT